MLNEYLRELLSVGFNIIEVEVYMNHNFDDNQKISEISNSFDIELQWKFNKKILVTIYLMITFSKKFQNYLKLAKQR
jgi:hypothetical protein